jgi:ABC-type lipoprotein export system ATPase subunit
MTMTDLSAPFLGEAGGSRETPAPSTTRTESGLVFDDTIDGLTLDEVSVVAIGDRPVVVPLTNEMATSTGFTILTVPEETLLSIGVLPRPVVPVVTVELPTFTPEPVAEDLPQVTDEIGLGEPKPVIATNWFDAPLPSPQQDVAPTPEGVAPSAVVEPETVLAPTLASVTVASDATMAPSKPSSVDFDLPAPVARSLSEVPVETARPIRAMAAAHRDWEPEALGWPYVERRTGDDAAPQTVAPVLPRSLSSGRPVNGGEPTELVVRQPVEPSSSTVISLQSAGSEGTRAMNLMITAGSLVVISGGRGAGKTSLLRLLAGFDPPTTGTAVVNGVDLASLDSDERAICEAVSAGFVPQHPFLVPDLSVVENVELPLLADGVPAAMAHGAALDVVRRVGLEATADVLGSAVSGSELRLAAEARAVVSSPAVVLVDEPLAGLPDEDAAAMLARFQDLVTGGSTVVMVCTDPRVRLLGVRHLVLRGGLIASDDIATTMLN